MAKNIRSLEEILHFGPQIGDTEELIAKLENKLDARLDPVHRDFLLRFGSVTIFGEWAFSNAEAIAKDPHGTFGVYVDYPPPWERIDLPASSSIAELICIAGGGNAEMMGWHPKRREFFIFETCPDTLISCGSSFISGFNALLDTNEGFAPRDFWPIWSQTFPKANCHEWNSQINPVLFPQHDGILRVPSIDEVVSIFWDIPFEHVYRSSSRVQLTSTSQETIVRYAIHEEALSRGCLNISQYQSRESFQLLIDRLKPRLIEAGFGHSFRPPRHRSSLDW